MSLRGNVRSFSLSTPDEMPQAMDVDETADCEFRINPKGSKSYSFQRWGRTYIYADCSLRVILWFWAILLQSPNPAIFALRNHLTSSWQRIRQRPRAPRKGTFLDTQYQILNVCFISVFFRRNPSRQNAENTFRID